MGSRFFGLTPNYKFQVYREVHDLVYYGQGGFIYSEVYNMPIHIRRFHIRKVNEIHEKRNQAHEEAMAKTNSISSKMPKTPNIPRNLKP